MPQVCHASQGYHDAKSLRCINISLNDLPQEYKIIIGYLTYQSGKLYNQALYLLKNKLAKVNMFDLYNKLNSSIHLKALHSRTAQIVLDELVIAYKNWFDENRPHTRDVKILHFLKTYVIIIVR